ncbi:MAG: TAXI family TRAP transporter solute-binding subunit [Deltaproteobacteria bacterium]|nr:TAXI family TRAP transporter solute-binding subunit [Deltaproteobacteria bacterium]
MRGKSSGFRFLVAGVSLFLAATFFTPTGSGRALAQQPFEITISTLPAGFASYIMGVALAEQVNKNSKWLRATATEGRGPAEHMKLLVTKPEKRKDYLFFNTTWDIWEAKKGIGPYAGFPFNYDEFRFVCIMGIAGNGLCTLDPKIKTLKDIEGKRAIFDSGKGKGREITYSGVLQAAGVAVDKIKFQYSTGSAAANALRDGLVDVIYTGHVLKDLPNVYVNSPYQAELVAAKDTYFIPFDAKSVKAYKEKTGHPLALVKVPSKMLGPKQPEPCGVLIKPLGFAAHVSMPEHVVMEVLRVAYENAQKFKEYTPMAAIFTKETLASLSIPAEGYHPAAVKFFKEKGVKITGFDE